MNDSKSLFSVTCITQCKTIPIYGMLSWHSRPSKLYIYNIPLFSGWPKNKQPVNNFTS